MDSMKNKGRKMKKVSLLLLLSVLMTSVGCQKKPVQSPYEPVRSPYGLDEKTAKQLRFALENHTKKPTVPKTTTTIDKPYWSTPKPSDIRLEMDNMNRGIWVYDVKIKPAWGYITHNSLAINSNATPFARYAMESITANTDVLKDFYVVGPRTIYTDILFKGDHLARFYSIAFNVVDGTIITVDVSTNIHRPFTVLSADGNLDGKVDLSDYALLEANFGRTFDNQSLPQSWKKGNYNLDGKIDLRDYMILEANFGAKMTYWVPGVEQHFNWNVGDSPKNWISTGENNSLIEDASLFQIGRYGPTYDFSLATESNIENYHCHYNGENNNFQNRLYMGRMLITEPDGNIGVTFLSDYPNSDNYYSLRRLNTSGPLIITDQQGNYVHLTGNINSGVAPEPNVWYRFVINFIDDGASTLITAKVWKDGENAPIDWQINCSDDSPGRLTNGTFGVWAGGNGKKYWDDLSVQ